jgi:hypothetical protein
MWGLGSGEQGSGSSGGTPRDAAIAERTRAADGIGSAARTTGSRLRLLTASASHYQRRAPASLVPDALGLDALDPDALKPDALEPDGLDPDALGPDALEPDGLDPDALGPGAWGLMPEYSSICVFRSCGYEMVTSVMSPLVPMTGVSFGMTKPV